MTQRSVLNWMTVGLFGLVGCHHTTAQPAPDPLAATSGTIEFCGQSLDLKTTEVRCKYTEVTDLSPLAGLTGLTTLKLGNTPVTDLSPLAGLTGLWWLDLSGTPVTDLSPLSGLTGLWRLELNDTPVTDLSPLFGLTGLTYLQLQGTPNYRGTDRGTDLDALRQALPNCDIQF